MIEVLPLIPPHPNKELNGSYSICVTELRETSVNKNGDSLLQFASVIPQSEIPRNACHIFD